MAIKDGHGNGAGGPRVEVLRATQLPDPIPAPPPDPNAVKPKFTPKGTFADKETAREMGRRGGLKKNLRAKLVASLGLKIIKGDSFFGSYHIAAEQFVVAETEALAKLAGGFVGPGPASIICTAAIELAISRWAFDKGCSGEGKAEVYFNLAAKWGDSSRQNLLAAEELAIREAEVRPKRAAIGAAAPWSLPSGGPGPRDGQQ